MEATESEGYVIRVANSFNYGGFKSKVCKFVIAKHVQTNKWVHGQAIERNGLKNDE